MEDGLRMVFSNKPTKMEHLIEPDLNDIARTFRNHKSTRRGLREVLKLKTRRNLTPSGMSYHALSATPDRLSLHQQGMLGQSIGLDMIAFDSDNHPILTYQTNVNLDFGDNLEADRARWRSKCRTSLRVRCRLNEATVRSYAANDSVVAGLSHAVPPKCARASGDL